MAGQLVLVTTGPNGKFQVRTCRYKWLIRPLIHRNAITSLDWIGKSAPVPLLKKKKKKQKKQSKRNLVTPKVTHTHTPP